MLEAIGPMVEAELPEISETVRQGNVAVQPWFNKTMAGLDGIARND